MARRLAGQLASWEGLLLAILVVIVVINTTSVPGYLTLQNQVNLFVLSIEKVLVVLIIAFVIISGEIDLSMASVMGLSAIIVAYLWRLGVPVQVGIAVALLAGVLAGLNNGFWVAVVGLPSLVVTLAGLIGYRGLAYVLIEDRSIGNFPAWFVALGHPILGPFPLSLILFAVGLVAAVVILQYSGFGRLVYAVGSSPEVARYSGVRVRRIKIALFVASGFVSALAGVLIAARLTAVRGSTAEGFELDIITMVLLGGVSIFGGSGRMAGVILSILVILNLRNGIALAGFSGNVQTGVIGALLILSVLLPNVFVALRGRVRRWMAGRRTEDGGSIPGVVSG
jgi:rhamnose transport system permease protein